MTHLAQTVAEASLRGAPMLIAVLVLGRVGFLRADAATRRALLLGTVLAVPALPALASLLSGTSLSWAIHVDPLGIEVPPPAPDGASVATWLSVVWMAGTSLMLARLIAGVARVRRGARAAATVRDPRWLADLEWTTLALGTGRKPELRMSREECMPHAWGWLRPVVVLPPSALGWSAGRRRAVLAHELGHVARHEPLARVAAELVRAVHWFDPFVRHTCRELRRESELAADQTVLGLGIEARDYVGHLVDLGRRRPDPAAPRGAGDLTAPGFAGGGELERRVEVVLATPPGGSTPRGRGSSWLAGPVLATCLIALAAVPRITPVGAGWAERYGISTELAAEILEAAAGEGIDPALGFALVSEESGFDREKVSSNGAVGLTQILPATARRVAPDVAAEHLRDPSVNLRLGFRYLRSQIDRGRGDTVEGLLGYALGPGRLARLRASGEALPLGYPSRILARLN